MTPPRAPLLLALFAACTPATLIPAPLDGSTPTDVPPITRPDVADGAALSGDVAFPFDGGALGEPPWVDVDVRTGAPCDALTRCGGEVRGTWDVGGVCIEVPIDDTVMRCPGARVTRRGGRARGRVTFDGARARRAAQFSAEVEVFIPGFCAALVGGCMGIQASVRAVAPDTTCATEGTNDCRCLARQSGMIDDADGYGTEGGQIVSATLNRRWDYCIAGATLRYRDVSAQGPREPGTITLVRR